MVDLKTETTTPTPKKTRHGLSMSTVKNWFVPEKKQQEQNHQQQQPTNFRKMPESFLRSLRRRSLRVKRTKSLVLPEKRKSGKFKKHKSFSGCKEQNRRF